MAVGKYLDISTSHITKEDADLLDSAIDRGKAPLGEKYDEGYYIHIPDPLNDFAENICEMRDNGFSQYMIGVMYYAYHTGARLLRLDADGDILDTLERFDW